MLDQPDSGSPAFLTVNYNKENKERTLQIPTLKPSTDRLSDSSAKNKAQPGNSGKNSAKNSARNSANSARSNRRH